MRDDSHHALGLAGSFRSRPQRRAQPAFVLGDGALSVPPPSVATRRKAVVHLSPVACLRTRIPNAPRIDRNDRRSNPQRLATEAMVPFGIVSAVAEEPMDRQVLGGLRDRRHKIGRVIARSVTHLQGGDQIRAMMRHQGHLRVTPVAFHTAGARKKVTAHMVAFDTGRIDGGFEAFFDQAALLGNTENGCKKSFKSPFFRSRSCAFCRVVK